MKKSHIILSALALSMAFVSSCKEDTPADPIIPNEEEVITTLTYTLTPVNGGDTVVLSFQDLDGDGGTDPTIIGGTLDSFTNYTGSLELLNELENPAGNITEEVLEEGEAHQFFFQPSNTNLSFDYADIDANGNPIGLQTTLATTDVGNGTLTIILRHEPSKEASGVASGDITNAGGETDIEVTFNVDVQ